MKFGLILKYVFISMRDSFLNIYDLFKYLFEDDVTEAASVIFDRAVVVVLGQSHVSVLTILAHSRELGGIL